MDEFLSLLMQGYSGEELRLEIRCLKPSWKDSYQKYPRAWFMLDDIKTAVSFCMDNRDEWDVFMGVLPRIGFSGSQRDISQANTLFCDIDAPAGQSKAAKELLEAAPIPLPHFVNLSGSGLHCYWFLKNPVPLPDDNSRLAFKQTLRRLCKAIGGTKGQVYSDPAAAEVSRILRPPNTFNRKIENNPREVITTCIRQHDPISYEEWNCILPWEPVEYKPPIKFDAYTPTGFISEGLFRWARKPLPVGDRYRGLMSGAAWLVRDLGLSKSDALMLLEIKASASGQGRSLTRKNIESMVQWTHN